MKRFLVRKVTKLNIAKFSFNQSYSLEQIKKGNIKVVPAIDRFTTSGVLFKNGDEYPFDAIILATGYRSGIQDFFDHEFLH